jgi:hypothetical protein
MDRRAVGVRRIVPWVASWAAAAPFWIFPAAVASTVAAFTQPVSTAQVLRSTAVLGCASGVVFALLAVIVRDLRRARVVLSLCALLFVVSPILAARLGIGRAWWSAISIWLFLSLLAVAGSRRSSTAMSDWIVPLNLMAVALGVIEIGLVYQSRPVPLDSKIRKVLNGIQNVHVEIAGTTLKPDVYDILLDSFGRPDVLRRRFGVDVGPVAQELEKRGFDVIRDARSNYDATYLSVPSMLNMNYLDALTPAMGSSGALAPLHELISTNVVMRTFRAAGYRTMLLGGGYSATQGVAAADECRCSPPLYGEFEAAVVSYTPFGRIGFAGLELSPHRERILDIFEALDHFQPPNQPVYVFAHVLSPHPPMVFARDGQALRPPGGFNFGGGIHYSGTPEDFTRRFEAQAQYIVTRALQAVDHVIAMSAERGRDAVVVVHGDHNTRFEGNEFAPKSSDGDDVLPILLAIRWAPARTNANLSGVRSLVNVYREVFRRYMGSRMPLLADRGFVAPFATPYRFIAATPSDAAPER